MKGKRSVLLCALRVLFALVCFSGCGSVKEAEGILEKAFELNDSDAQADGICGVWRLISMTHDGETTLYDGTGIVGTYEFTPDGRMICIQKDSSGEYSMNATYETIGSVLIATAPNGNTSMIEFSIEGGMLTLNGNGNTQVLTYEGRSAS